MSQLPEAYRTFLQDYPTVAGVYEQLGAAAAEAGPLDAKTRELVKLAMAAALGSEGAVHSHVHRALAAGATAAEIEHTLILGVTTLGFPTMMMALRWARTALHQATSPQS
ncbi:MAG TPA: carboxymuconolactone decarboxylase family protein [Chloroflexus aurantiacus]|jgi:AhpD family alkylhydroperoxidase|uniref:Alkylhydroperoxidase like protein, AhpD family n=2 Tax=Bacillati TaxID=1783272 RepID=A9WAQ3_CHLAA|nr:carboxymuconolactone decarboxylase family protein [Chloroflexus aurantiacus]ABY33281.1 alkylhydroperoxidase like protein, AhpD family [Chloroflexus aurantiacus J-10-fl]RMG51230.1 MAG: carboxymuconolactone decarboxylase family protein [Chloroflexota bacterium]HBW66982.1 carboxymuconolactone decarboxylase family protein [Chloroflexus aurantiacus]